MPVYTLTFEAKEQTGINVDTATHLVGRGHKQGHIRCRNSNSKQTGTRTWEDIAAHLVMREHKMGHYPQQEQ